MRLALFWHQLIRNPNNKNFEEFFGEFFFPGVAWSRSICERAKKIPKFKTKTPRAPISFPHPITHQKRRYCDSQLGIAHAQAPPCFSSHSPIPRRAPTDTFVLLECLGLRCVGVADFRRALPISPAGLPPLDQYHPATMVLFCDSLFFDSIRSSAK